MTRRGKKGAGAEKRREERRRKKKKFLTTLHRGKKIIRLWWRFLGEMSKQHNSKCHFKFMVKKLKTLQFGRNNLSYLGTFLSVRVMAV